VSASRWLGALALDLAFGEPPAAIHPVVLLGRAIAQLEAIAPRAPAAQLAHGALLVAGPAIAATASGVAVRGLRPRVFRTFAALWLLKTTFALRGLVVAGDTVAHDLESGDVAGARTHLRTLVSRPTGELDAPHVASAVIESLAENLCDSYVAPLLWYRLGGLPAALAYRAVNTADAMVGYHGPYEHLGKAAARLDDVLNLVPARLTALALAVAAPLVGLRGREALRGAWREHARTESPNAGWPMAAAAGACGVWLEKAGHYRLGGERVPAARDVRRARTLALAGATVATIALLAVARRDG